MHGGTVIYGACHSNKERIVPYFGRGVHFFDFVNEYLMLIVSFALLACWILIPADLDF